VNHAYRGFRCPKLGARRVLVGLVYGFNVDEVCIFEFDIGDCGWPFFGLLLPAWYTFGLWTMTGGIAGGILAVTAARLTRGRQSSPPARVRST
jgi:hypothetical protein